MRPREKPDSAAETARVLRILDMLLDDLARRFPPSALVVVDASTRKLEPDPLPDLLAIADRIAARTEDPA